MVEINESLVFTIINLIILYLLMKKFLFGRVLGIIEQRKNMLEQQFSSARESEARARSLETKYEEALRTAKDESFRIVDQAKAEARTKAERILQDANSEAASLMEKAQKNIRMEKENAMKDMETKVAELAMDAASRILGDKSGAAQDLSLYDQFIKEAGDSNDGDI